MLRRFLVIAAVTAFAGCATEHHGFGRGPNSESRLTIVQAVESLVTDLTFTELYTKAMDNAKAAGKERPTVTILQIENNADNRGDAATRQMYRRLQTAVRKTGKFEIVDPAGRKMAVDVIESGANNGEDGGSLQNYGNYHSSDFVMHGELVLEEDGEKSLNLQMTDVRTGAIFWSEVVTPSDALNR